MGPDHDNQISRLIVGDGPDVPEWLLCSVSKAKYTLNNIVNSESKHPTRNDLRNKLDTLANAAKFVRAMMTDVTISQHLLSGDYHFLHQYEMNQGLLDLEEKAKSALKKIPVGKGRNKSFSKAEGLSSRVNCALMVSIIWHHIHGKWPPVANEYAMKACATLWAVSGGETKNNYAGGDSVSVWRDHLRAAKKACGSREAELLRRSLIPVNGG